MGTPWLTTFAQRSPFAEAFRSTGQSQTGTSKLRAELNELPPEEWPTRLRRLISDQISLILRRSIDPDRPLSEYGVDSLGALELRTRIRDRNGNTPHFQRPRHWHHSRFGGAAVRKAGACGSRLTATCRLSLNPWTVANSTCRTWRFSSWSADEASRRAQRSHPVDRVTSLRFLNGAPGALLLGAVGEQDHLATALGHIAVRRRVPA